MLLRHRRLRAALIACSLGVAASSCGDGSTASPPSSSSVATTTSTASPSTPNAPEPVDVAADTTHGTTSPDMTTPGTTAPAPPTSLADDQASVEALLLTAEDVGTGWRVEQLSPYVQTPDEDTTECQAYNAINTIGRNLSWSTVIANDSDESVFNAIGRAPAATAQAMVAEFALIAACDNTGVFGEGTSAGGVLDVDGADAAAVLRFSPLDNGEHTDLAAISVDDVVMLVGVAWTADIEPNLSTLIDHLADFVVTKVRNA